MVADALSRKSVGVAACQITSCAELIKDFEKLELEVFRGGSGLLSQLTVQVTLQERVRQTQCSNAEYLGLMEQVRAGKRSELTVDEHGVLLCGSRLWVPASGGLRLEILHEAHFAGYSIHPGSGKMYQDRSKPIERTRKFLSMMQFKS